jgi:hypothetical protein
MQVLNNMEEHRLVNFDPIIHTYGRRRAMRRGRRRRKAMRKTQNSSTGTAKKFTLNRVEKCFCENLVSRRF